MTTYQRACDLLAESYNLPKDRALEKVQHAQYLFKKIHAWPEYWKARTMESRLFLNPAKDVADVATLSEAEEKEEAEARHLNNLEAEATGN